MGQEQYKNIPCTVSSVKISSRADDEFRVSKFWGGYQGVRYDKQDMMGKISTIIERYYTELL